MLTKLELWIEYEHEEKFNYNISSLLHGVLMEQISPEYAQVLHMDGRKPFCQNIAEMTDHSFRWEICTLNLEAKQKIIDVMMMKKSFHLQHKKTELKVTRWNLSGTTYEELIEHYYLGENPRNICIRFQTPTAFKSKGRYVFMPDVRLIFQSLMNKYDAFSGETQVGGAEILEHFEDYAQISRYRLRSVRYALEGVWISAFVGEVTIRVNGPQAMVNLAHMLAAFGEYSGVGIKTALGMGHIQIVEGEKK